MTPTATRLLACASLALAALPAVSQTIPAVPSLVETASLTENDRDADADDPSFWVDPADAARTLVIVAAKNGGMRVYDLAGALVQDIPAAPEQGDVAGRINNVDVIYGLTMPDGATIDVAVASDRGLDIIRVFRIDGAAAAPLAEITDPAGGRAFPVVPDAAGGADLDNPVADQATVYGLTGWRNDDGRVYVAGTQRQTPRIGIWELTGTGAGLVLATPVQDVRFPWSFAGQDLTRESDEDLAQDWSPQFEGLVHDRVTGMIYAGEEDVGIWRIDPVTGDHGGAPVVTTRGAPGSTFRAEDSVIARDVEGLTVYYGATEHYLLASSQGQAHGDLTLSEAPWDDTFAVFVIGADGGLIPRGSFAVAATGDRDAVQESDGADVIATALPGFPYGLFVTQDGYDNDLNGLDGEVASTNFKFVDWAAIAAAFEPPLEVNAAWSPRD